MLFPTVRIGLLAVDDGGKRKAVAILAGDGLRVAATVNVRDRDSGRGEFQARQCIAGEHSDAAVIVDRRFRHTARRSEGGTNGDQGNPGSQVARRRHAPRLSSSYRVCQPFLGTCLLSA